MKKIIQIPLPYWNERPKKCAIKAIVLHCSAHEGIPMVKLLNKLRLSAHFVIGTDGRIFQLVPEEKRAFHAGVSSWREMVNLNHYSIGIELSSPSMGEKVYSDEQLASLVSLCRALIRRYNIPAENIAAHSDVAPTRKPDPGKAFPWQRFAACGVGLWYDLNDADKIKENDVEKLLKIIGYNTDNLPAASYAFCRHFVPELIQEQGNISDIITNVYPANFVLPSEYLPHLKACAYKFSKRY
ncbi:MAG: N-acetylmuramoyl-L-alanine amidase [Alphaproteobacteria bacterium]|nr:N-acetylmuramoyl-L-alanine amidase [Alphaproteobacteria bacterium]